MAEFIIDRVELSWSIFVRLRANAVPRENRSNVCQYTPKSFLGFEPNLIFDALCQCYFSDSFQMNPGSLKL